MMNKHDDCLHLWGTTHNEVESHNFTVLFLLTCKKCGDVMAPNIPVNILENTDNGK